MVWFPFLFTSIPNDKEKLKPKFHLHEIRRLLQPQTMQLYAKREHEWMMLNGVAMRVRLT